MRHAPYGTFPMMIGVALGGCVSQSEPPPPLVTEEQVHELLLHEPPPYSALSGTVEVANVGLVPFRLEVSSKGDGTLEVENLVLRVYDDHDDGFVFSPRLLDVVPFALLGDACIGILVSGVVVEHSEEPGTSPCGQFIQLFFPFDEAKRKFIPPEPIDDRIVLSY